MAPVQVSPAPYLPILTSYTSVIVVGRKSGDANLASLLAVILNSVVYGNFSHHVEDT